MAARILKVDSELGKQLDSLADMVTSGVAPGIVMYQLIFSSMNQNSFATTFVEKENLISWNLSDVQLLPFIAFLLPVAAAYRLAKFNLDERQLISFIGLPTPAMSIFVISLPLILIYSDISYVNNLINNTYFLVIITILLSFIMNAELQLFSLKFKKISLKNNWVQLVFIIIALVSLIVLKFVAIPLIIALYILLSLIKKVSST